MTIASGGKNQWQWREYGAVCKPEHLKINVKNYCIYILNVYGYYSKWIYKYFFLMCIFCNYFKYLSWNIAANIITDFITEPLKWHDGGKNRGEWKKFGVGGKNICKFFCVLSQNFCVPSRNFAQKFCSLSQNQLSSDKHFLFILQLAVVHSSVCSQLRDSFEFYSLHAKLFLPHRKRLR